MQTDSIHVLMIILFAICRSSWFFSRVIWESLVVKKKEEKKQQSGNQHIIDDVVVVDDDTNGIWRVMWIQKGFRKRAFDSF